MSVFNFDNETLVAITSAFAVIVSIISVIFTVIFSLKQNEHNKNSVRPISSILINDYKDKIAVRIDNVGTGPLTIKKIVIKKDGKHFSDLVSILPDVKYKKFHHPDNDNIEGRTIPVGGSLTLFEVSPKNDEDRVAIRKELSKATVFVDYVNIYNNKFSDKRSLEFFGRNIEDE